MNCFSWIKLIHVLMHLKYLYCNSSYLELPFLLHLLGKIYLSQLKPSSAQYSSCSSSVFLFCSAPFGHKHHRYWIYQTMCKANPTKFITKLYTGHNTFWVEHTTHQNVESLRPTFLSKLDNIVNNNSIVNTKDAEFSTKWYVFLRFHNFTCANNQCFNLQ